MIHMREDAMTLWVDGHAADRNETVTPESHDVCVMVTVLIGQLVTGIRKVCGESPALRISYGSFVLDKRQLSGKSRFLVTVFRTGMLELADRYPRYLHIETIDQKEKQDMEERRQAFPDWREYLVNPSGKGV